MVSTTVDSKRAVAGIFNSAIAAPAIGAAWEVGFLDEVRSQGKVDVQRFAAQNGLDSSSMQGLVTALVVVDVVKREHDKIVAGALFDETYRTKSMFHWLALGSGGLFSRMHHGLGNKLQREEHHPDAYYRRDPEAIAYACTDINNQYYNPAFWTALKGLDFRPQCVVDLGSGGGDRLMQILAHFPESTGMGIDVAGPAIKYAASEAAKRGFGDRLSFTEGDARAMNYRDEFANVDLITCFMMGHDFWPRENCVTSLRRLRESFPRVRRCLLGDAIRTTLNNPQTKHAVTENNVPIWSLGFEFGHALMDVYIPTVEEWEGVFAAGGWRCVKKHLIEAPPIGVIFELEHAWKHRL